MDERAFRYVSAYDECLEGLSLCYAMLKGIMNAGVYSKSIRENWLTVLLTDTVAQAILEVAERLFAANPDWIIFFPRNHGA